MTRIILSFIIVLITTLTSTAQSAPQWVKKTPRASNDDFRYQPIRGYGDTYDQALRNATQHVKQYIHDAFVMDETEIITVDGEKIYVSIDGQTFQWPMLRICDQQMSDNEWWFLYQIANKGILNPKYDYFDCYEVDKNDLHKLDRTALACSFFPGLGQIIVKKNKPVGYAFMIGDLALVGGGVYCLLESNNQYDISQNPNYTSNYRQDAYDNYKMLDTSCKILFGAAAAVYVINLYTAYKMSTKTKGFAFAPKLIPENNNLAYGIGISYNF